MITKKSNNNFIFHHDNNHDNNNNDDDEKKKSLLLQTTTIYLSSIKKFSPRIYCRYTFVYLFLIFYSHLCIGMFVVVCVCLKSLFNVNFLFLYSVTANELSLNENGLTSSSLSRLSSSSSSSSDHQLHHRMLNNPREFVPLAEIQSEQFDDQYVKCLYYNRTLCQQTNNKEGCGESVQICSTIDNLGHNTGDAYCYALWRNSTNEGVQLVFKGCWYGASKSCSNEESLSVLSQQQQHHKMPCVPAHQPKQKDLNFCCCKGILCNEEIKQMPNLLLYSSTPAPEQHGLYCFLFLF